jgi:8-hydroxy-5-deazaflavin:NADPH oxidoreductase
LKGTHVVDRLGILGAGKLGTAVARLAVDAGRQVLIADERTGPMIQLIVSTVASGARLVSKDEMLASSDIVLLASRTHGSPISTWPRSTGRSSSTPPTPGWSRTVRTRRSRR